MITLKKQHKRYSDYKDSRVEWIGEIPSDWKVYKVKHVSSFTSGDGFPEEFQGNEEGEIPFYKVSDINKNEIYVTASNNYVSSKLVKKNKWHLIKDNSILLAKIGAALLKNHRKINKLPCCIDNNMLAVAPNHKLSYFKYLFWLFNNLDMGEFVNVSSVPSINMNYLKNYQFAYPDFSEQQIIVTYLDEKTALLDSIIEKKKQQIELLKEKRTALINKAVTRGLDDNAEMKDSGVEWIGEIPKGWKVEKIKFISPLSNKKTSTPNSTKPYLALENVESWTGNLINMKDDVEFESIVNVFRSGDVLFGKLRPYLAKVVFVDFDGVCTGEMLVLRPNKKKVLQQFLFYRMISSEFINIVNLSTYGAKMPRANWTFIGNLEIGLPPLEEQRTIIESLEKGLIDIDNLVGKLKVSIELLQEYKTSLISNVVTGKVKVT